MKPWVVLIGVLLSIAPRPAPAQDKPSIFIARLDSTHDEMTGRTSYTVQITSPDSTRWTYGWAAAALLLRCSSDANDPKWIVGSGATPHHTFGNPDLASMQMKTDSEYVASVIADYFEAGRVHLLRVLDNKNFTKRVMKSKSLVLRWGLLTNEQVTFHYDVTTLTPLIPQLYAVCGKDVPR